MALWALLSVIGLFITHTEAAGNLAWDGNIVRWFEAHRTPTFNPVSAVGSGMADTKTCIAVTIILIISLRLGLGRWYESWVLTTAITGELWVFLAVTFTVHRPRPAVVLMDSAPPTSSFPSGHTAAAVALYGCMAVLLVRRFRHHPAAWLGATLLALVPLFVAWSRLYRGMHFPTDVAVGALGGGLWLLIVITTFPGVRVPRPAIAAPVAATDTPH